MASPAPERRAQLALYGVGLAALSSALLALLVRLPDGAGLGLSLTLHGPRLLLALAAGAGMGVAGAFQAAEDDAGWGHPLLFALAAGAALGVSRGSSLQGLSPLPNALLGAGECALFFSLLVLGARRLRGWARLATGVLLLLLLGAAIVATLDGKGDPSGLRPWVFWLLGDVSAATWATAVPASLGILVLSLLLLRRAPAGCELAALAAGERRRLLGLAGLLFGLCLGAAGLVAFLAVMVAIAARWLLGHGRLRAWVGLSALLGALAMVTADALPHALFGGLAPPLGVGVAMLAVPWFLLRNDGRSAPTARAVEVVLGLLLASAVAGATLVLYRLAAFIA